jgi:hypothetical protein
VRGPQKAQPFVGPLDRRVRALVVERHEFGGGRHCQPKHTTARLELGEGTTASAHFGSLDERGLATKAERRLSGAPTFWLNKRAKRNPLTDYSECAKRRSDCFDSELAICSVLRQRVLHTFVSALTFDMRGAQKAQPFGLPLDGRVRRLVTEGRVRFHLPVPLPRDRGFE